MFFNGMFYFGFKESGSDVHIVLPDLWAVELVVRAGDSCTILLVSAISAVLNNNKKDVHCA